MVEQLKRLLRINLASVVGFLAAADNVDDPTLIDLFMAAAEERRLAAEQLAGVLADLVVPPIRRDRSAPGIHRWWIDAHARFSGDRHGLLVDAEHGEKQIVDAYDQALACTAGSSVNDLIQRQHDKAKSIHEQILILRNEAA